MSGYKDPKVRTPDPLEVYPTFKIHHMGQGIQFTATLGRDADGNWRHQNEDGTLGEVFEWPA